MQQILALLIPFAGIAMVFGIVYLGVTSDSKKDLAMIEAGMNPNNKPKRKRKSLRTALLLIFIPIGLFLGNYISGAGIANFTKPTGIIFAFLFGGLALLLFYYLDMRAEEKEQKR
ncbi:MAG: hypothetical protein JKY48_17335 [Flavobacteriales bacterium]|nr:hypothetical protein [Flavobacteriales bacterium]